MSSGADLSKVEERKARASDLQKKLEEHVLWPVLRTRTVAQNHMRKVREISSNGYLNQSQNYKVSELVLDEVTKWISESDKVMLGKLLKHGRIDDEHVRWALEYCTRDKECLELLLGDERVDINVLTKNDNRTLLQYAVAERDSHLLGKLLKHERIDDEHVRLALQHWTRDNECLELLMGMNVLTKKYNRTFLQKVVTKGDSDLLGKLLKDERIDDEHARLALQHWTRDMECLDLLIGDKRVDINVVTKNGNLLQYAVEVGDSYLLGKLLHDPRIDKQHVNRAMEYCSRDEKCLEILLGDDRVDINVPNAKDGLTLLEYAIGTRRYQYLPELVYALVQHKGIQVNSTRLLDRLDDDDLTAFLANVPLDSTLDGSCLTLLQYVFEKRRLAVLKKFLKGVEDMLGVEEMSRSAECFVSGLTQLQVAVLTENSDSVKRILQHEGRDGELGHEDVQSAWFCCDSFGECFKLLLEDPRSNVNLLDSTGKSMLQSAVTEDDEDLVRALFESGRNIEVNSEKALDEITFECLEAMLENSFIDLNADLVDSTRSCYSVWKYLVDLQKPSLITKLLQRPELEMKRIQLARPYYRWHADCFEILLDDPRTEYNRLDIDGVSMVDFAVRFKHPHLLRKLLQKPGIEVQPTDLLETASGDCLEVLVDHPKIIDINVPIQVNNYSSILHKAIGEGYCTVLQKILKNYENIDHLEAALIRVHWDDHACCNLLIQDPRVDINLFRAAVADQYNILHKALFVGDVEIVRTLLKQPKIDVNATTTNGWSPLFRLPLIVLKYQDRDFDDGFRRRWDAFALYLKDPRVQLSHRDASGCNILECDPRVAPFSRYVAAYVEQEPGVQQGNNIIGYLPELVNLIRLAERNRFRWAQNRVEVLRNWTVPNQTQVIDQAILSTHILSFLADTLTPTADLCLGNKIDIEVVKFRAQIVVIARNGPVMDDVFYKSKYATRVRTWMTKFCNKLGFNFGSVKFYYRGQPILDANETPNSLNMQPEEQGQFAGYCVVEAELPNDDEDDSVGEDVEDDEGPNEQQEEEEQF